MFSSILLYLGTGLLSGLLSGLLGIGGGVVVVPALLLIFAHQPQIPSELSMHIAAATSMAVMIWSSLSSLYGHYHFKHPILWSVYRKMGLWIILGTLCGVAFSHDIPVHWLKIFFGCFLLYVAYNMLRKIFHWAAERSGGAFPSTTLHRFICSIIGLKSGLLGVGGGILIIPYLGYCGVESRSIAPISSLCTLSVALTGTLLNMWTGHIEWEAVLWVALGSIISSILGARWATLLPIRALESLFVLVLLCTSYKLFTS